MREAISVVGIGRLIAWDFASVFFKNLLPGTVFGARDQEFWLRAFVFA
jgi:3-isopropylmalate dehydratase small subunit